MVWGVPIMALMLGASLVYQTYQDKGPTIEISFPFAAGLKAEATPIKFLEVEVGRVTEVRLNDALDGVIAVAELDPGSESYLKDGTVFWLVRPQVTMAGISAIETLLSGQYIEVIPSQTGKRKSNFVGQLNPPIGVRYRDGKTIVLETENLGSISRGTSVYYRNLRAGEVEHYEIGENNEPIRIYVVIDKEFAPRIRENSLFWNASGIETQVGLDGVTIRTEGLASVIGGGIAFSSPEVPEGPDEGAPEAASDSVFRLHPGADAARIARVREQALEIRIESHSGEGLGSGAPIYYRGLEIGHIGESWLTADARAVRSEVFIEAKFRPLIRENTRFYKSSGVDVSIGLDGVNVRSGPLRSIALGAIAIATPNSTGAEAEPQSLFALYSEPEEAWLAWQPSIELDEARPGEPIRHQLPPNAEAGSLDLVLHTQEIGSVTSNSQITYRNLPVGRVLKHVLSRDGESVDIHVRISAPYRHLVGDATRFWRPAAFSMDVGLTGVDFDFDSLRTLALGGVAFDNPQGPGAPIEPRARFFLHADEKTAFQDVRDALSRIVYVEAAESSLSVGAPVYFRKFKIGEVGESTLTSDALGVRTALRIDREYVSLVRRNSHFWSAGAISLRGGLSGIDVEVAPLQAILAGGVMLATPTDAGAEAETASVFRLEDAAPSGSEKWRPDLPLTAGALAMFNGSTDQTTPLRIKLVARDATSLNEGDPIFYRGLEVGAVSSSKIASDGRDVILGVAIEADYAFLIRSNTEFWNASGIDVDLGLSGLKVETGPLETFVQGGILFATPDPAAAAASAGQQFELLEKPDEDWQEWSPNLR